MKQFALWLATTPPSVFIQEHNAWTIPTIQSVHILGIALVLGSAFMINLRILGWAETDQSLSQTVRRFGPWVTGSLLLMLVTGILMVVGQPMRELMSFSFRLKMALVAIATLASIAFHRILREYDVPLSSVAATVSTRAIGLLIFLAWVGVIVLGRLIAYDHVWGAWSPAGD